MFIEELRSAVGSWRPGLAFVATVPPCPLTPQISLSFIRQHIPINTYLSWLMRFETPQALFIAGIGVERGLNINIGIWPEIFQWRTVTHILRQKSDIKSGDIHKNGCLQIQIILYNPDYTRLLLLTSSALYYVWKCIDICTHKRVRSSQYRFSQTHERLTAICGYMINRFSPTWDNKCENFNS
jgi:hypothetical protein